MDTEKTLPVTLTQAQQDRIYYSHYTGWVRTVATLRADKIDKKYGPKYRICMSRES